MDIIVEKTEIFPTVLVIYPSGYTESLETDVNSVPLNDLGALIDAEEDIENVFEAIDELTGLLRREMDDDGRFDAWA